MALLPGQHGAPLLVQPDAVDRNEGDVRRVVRDYAGFVGRSLRYLGVGEADLEDAAQEVFIVVHRRLDDFEGRSLLRTWLYGICLRVAHSLRRKAATRREHLMAEPPERGAAPGQDAELQAKEARARLQHLLAELDEEQRSVFVLYEIERMPMKAVAEAMGCPLQTAYYRHQAARRKLLASFQPSQGGES